MADIKIYGRLVSGTQSKELAQASEVTIAEIDGIEATTVQGALEEVVADQPTKVSDLVNDSGFLTQHQSLADVFGDVAYDSQTKRINFYGNGDTNHTTVLAYVDATNFIKDGMVSNVEITNGNLVITFNTDSGKEPISLALTQIFNASNYYTKTEVDAIIDEVEAGATAITGNCDVAVVEGVNYIDIFFYQTELTVTTLAAMSASTKSGTFTVSGSHLKGDVTVSTSATNWTLSSDGGTTTSQSLTLSPSDGSLAETTITVAYSGSTDSTGNTITIASTGATSKTVTASYTVYSGPTILVSPSTLSFSIAPNSTEQKTLTVTGANLNSNITATLSGTNSSLFTLSANSLQSSGDTLTVTYSPTAEGSHSATLTLSSTGAESVTVSLSGTAENAITSDAEGKFTKVVNGKTLYLKRIIVDGEKTTDVGVFNADYNTSSAANTKYTGDIVIPSTVTVDGVECTITSIASACFHSCTGLTSVSMPNTLTSIGVYSFRGCTNNSFTSLIFPDSVTSLGTGAVYQCTKLQTLVFGSGITTIPQWVIPKATLNTIVFGAVTNFSTNTTFYVADNGSVTINNSSSMPNYQGKVFTNASENVPCGAYLYVPSNMVNSYKTSAYGWGVNNNAGYHMFDPDKILAISE